MQSGQSVEQIKESLFQSGWQSADIEAAFATISPSTPQPVSVPIEMATSTPSKKKLYIGLGVLFVVIAGVAVAAYVFGFPARSQSPQTQPPKTNPTPIQSTPVVTSSPLEAEKKVDTTEFVDSAGTFAFDYVKSWKIQSQETMALLSNPQNPDATKCDGVLTNFEFCDAVISSIPYSGVHDVAEGVTVSAPPEPSHEDQVKQLVAQLGTVENVESDIFTNAHGLKGHLVKSPAPEGNEKNAYNFLFEGKKNMILVQIPVKVGETVSEDHKIIIQSVKEP